MKMVTCPFCNRECALTDGRFRQHTITPRGVDVCPTVGFIAPVTGHDEVDYEDRARLITELAMQLQDTDPVLVWTYLTALPAAEVQRLLMIALTAIPSDRTLHDTFPWVAALPIAQDSAA
jgi:hypothetical protein